MSKCYLKMKAHLFPILTLRELTNRQKYLQNRQMLSGRKEQHNCDMCCISNFRCGNSPCINWK